MAHRSPTALPLSAILDRLARLYSFKPPSSSAFELILRENIGYLIDDGRRDELFHEFGQRIGFTAARIARAPDALLLDIAQRGGMRPETRVERWQRIAKIHLNEASGDLDVHLRSLPVAGAGKLLKRFPAIGDPGADRILLFCGLDPRPAVDSNGLRVLARLGLVEVAASYASNYRSAIACLAAALTRDRDRLVSAYMLLREHGRALCKRTTPHCTACPLDPVCAHVPAKGL